MRSFLLTASVLAATTSATVAQASETITYSYDARGRLKQAVHSGSVNNGVTKTYTHDKANNRQTKVITGASADLFVVPLGGMAVIRRA